MNIYATIANWATRRAGTPAHDPRKCAHCQEPRRLHDKIHTLAWAHDVCATPTVRPLPEPLMGLLERERI